MQIPLIIKYKKTIITFFILLCFVNFMNAQQIGFYFDGNQKRARIPFELHNNLIVISVTINGKHPLNFIVDSGVRPTVLINKAFADALGITYVRSIELAGIGNSGTIDALVSREVSLSMPGVSSAGMTILVLDQDFLQLEKHLGIHIHGLLGYDLFSRFIVKIDYKNQKIELTDPQQFKAKKRYFPIDLEVVESKPIASLNLQLSASEAILARLLVDTGASNALVLNENSNAKIHVPERNISTVLGRGLLGEINGKQGRIAALWFGEKALPDVIASFPDESTFSPDTDYQRNGSIGGELLRKFTVIFNFVDKLMYIKPNASWKYPFEYNMSGLEFSAEGKNLNQIVISHIREYSPAFECGFQNGDLVVQMNGISDKNLTLTKIYSNLNQRAGKKITLTVQRDGKYYVKTFRLKPVI